MQEKIPYILIKENIKNLYIQIKDGKVIVKAPRNFSQKQIEAIIREKQAWIEKNLQKSIKRQEREDKYSQEEFIKIVEETAKELISITGLKPNRVKLRQINYAWGSCSSKKNITISKKLIYYSKHAIRYVILHELCHLKYMNHRKEFWNLIETYMPDYKDAKKELRE